MLKNLYREKMKFFNKNLHRNKTLIIDESDKNYTKDEIYIFSKRTIFSFKKKNLILFCGGNDAISILYSPSFQEDLSQVRNPYGEGGASEKVVHTLKSINIKNIVKKAFYNLPNSVLGE